jgi:hypothetical protein
MLWHAAFQYYHANSVAKLISKSQPEFPLLVKKSAVGATRSEQIVSPLTKR